MLDSQQVAILAQEIACAIRDGIREGFADSRAARARCEQSAPTVADWAEKERRKEQNNNPAHAAAGQLGSSADRASVKQGCDSPVGLPNPVASAGSTELHPPCTGSSGPAGAAASHVHTDACWEPGSGCDLGRNEKYVRRSMPDETAAIKAASDEGAGDLKEAMEWLESFHQTPWESDGRVTLQHIAAQKAEIERLKELVWAKDKISEEWMKSCDSLRAELDKARPWLEWLKEWHEVARMALQFSSYPLNSKDAYAAMPKEPPK